MTNIAPGAHAIFMPPRENFLEAIQEALEVQHGQQLKLYTDGRRCAWLPRVANGWQSINSVSIREPA